MDLKIKNGLGVAIIIAVLLLGYAAVAYVNAFSASIEPSSFRSFSTTAEGKIVAVPDVAQFTFSVITQGSKDIGTLQTQNTKKVNGAIDFVKGKGVDAKDIKTQDYSLDPRYQYYNCNTRYDASGEVQPCPPPEIVGYTVTQTVLVKVRDFTKVGDILSGVVNNGANSVSQLAFTIDDPTQLENQAREDAIAKAKTRAQAIARAGGFTLGRLLGIDEGSSGSYYYDSMKRAESAYGIGGGAAVPAPTIEPGSKDITVNVTLRYEIK